MNRRIEGLAQDAYVGQATDNTVDANRIVILRVESYHGHSDGQRTNNRDARKPSYPTRRHGFQTGAQAPCLRFRRNLIDELLRSAETLERGPRAKVFFHRWQAACLRKIR